MNDFITYFKLDPEMVFYREYLIDMFSFKLDRPVYPEKPKLPNGIVLAKPTDDMEKAEYGYYKGEEFVKLPKSTKPGSPFSPYDYLSVSKRDIINGPDKPVDSSVGHFLLNYIAFASTFGTTVPYVNKALRKMRSIEETICESIIDGKTTIAQYKEYVNKTTRFLHFSEIFLPTLSEKNTSIDPAILKHRDKLLKEHAHELNDPVVVDKIDRELVAMYIEWAKKDPSFKFNAATPDKSFQSHIKRMYIMLGGISDFGSPETITVGRSIQEGMNADTIAVLSNESRKGAASRAVQTQVSGYYTKLLARALQDVTILEDDCGDKEGTTIEFSTFNHPLRFVGRNVIVKGKLVEITKSTLNQYLDKTYQLRSPMSCKTRGGFCYRCMGEIFHRLQIKSPGILGIDITSTSFQRSMKLMHIEITKIRTFNLEDHLI